jgi:hypothetical protein
VSGTGFSNTKDPDYYEGGLSTGDTPGEGRARLD